MACCQQLQHLKEESVNEKCNQNGIPFVYAALSFAHILVTFILYCILKNALMASWEKQSTCPFGNKLAGIY
jgi:hypothetical protein